MIKFEWFGGMLRGIGIFFCVTVPVCYVLIVFCVAKISWRFAGFSCVELIAVSCLVLSLLIGHILMCIFWHTFRAHKNTDESSKQDLIHQSIESNELARIHDFIEKTFAGSLRIISDYRFPNGYRADVVAVKGRGEYPMMCIEIIDGEDGERKITDAVQELYHAFSFRLPFMRCFILRRFKDGRFELLEVRSPSNYRIVGAFDPALREEMEDDVDRAVNEVKKRKVIFPILFLLLVVTPIFECVVTLTYFKFPITGAINAMIVVWIGAFLGLFGVSIKGYEPTVSDLMNS